MSLETKVAELTAAIDRLTQIIHLHGAGPVQQAPVVPAAPPVLPPAPPVAAPVVEVVVPEAPPAPPAPPPMPALPTFAPPPAAPVVEAVPFQSPQGLIEWATQAFHGLEAQQKGKGARLAEVLSSLGAPDLTSVRPDQYAAFVAGVAALHG